MGNDFKPRGGVIVKPVRGFFLGYFGGVQMVCMTMQTRMCLGCVL
jgi:hypothetical protein